MSGYRFIGCVLEWTRSGLSVSALEVRTPAFKPEGAFRKCTKWVGPAEGRSPEISSSATGCASQHFKTKAQLYLSRAQRSDYRLLPGEMKIGPLKCTIPTVRL